MFEIDLTEVIGMHSAGFLKTFLRNKEYHFNSHEMFTKILTNIFLCIMNPSP